MRNKIARVVDMVEADEGSIGLLSTGEVIVAALLFNRMDWLPEEYRHPLDAIDRLGADWLEVMLECHRQRGS
jgi:hypothetical protein